MKHPIDEVMKDTIDPDCNDLVDSYGKKTKKEEFLKNEKDVKDVKDVSNFKKVKEATLRDKSFTYCESAGIVDGSIVYLSAHGLFFDVNFSNLEIVGGLNSLGYLDTRHRCPSIWNGLVVVPVGYVIDIYDVKKVEKIRSIDIYKIKRIDSNITDLTIHDNLFLCAVKNKILLIDPENEKLLKTFKSEKKASFSVSLDDKRFIAVFENTIEIWEKGRTLWYKRTEFKACGNVTDLIVMNPQMIVSSCENKIEVWDLKEETIVRKSTDFPTIDNSRMKLKVLDSDHFLTVYEIGKIVIWSILTFWPVGNRISFYNGIEDAYVHEGSIIAKTLRSVEIWERC